MGGAAGKTESDETFDDVYAHWRRKAGDEGDAVEQVDPETFLDALHAGTFRGRRLVVVDARSAPERAVSTIAGSVPSKGFDEDPHDVFVVVFCTVGFRATLVSEKLAKRGFQTACLYGSLLGWARNARPMVEAETGRPTDRVHCFLPALGRWRPDPDQEPIVFGRLDQARYGFDY